MTTEGQPMTEIKPWDQRDQGIYGEFRELRMYEEIEELRAALAKSQPVEQGKPVRPMSDEPVLGTKTWMEGGVVMTQNLTASDIYKPVPMTEDEFITAVEASGIEVDNVEAAFAIKRIVELFHGIKGATE